MPTYKNSSTHRRTVGSSVIEPGEEIQLLTYHNLRGAEFDGVFIKDDYPYYSPIILSERIDRDTVIEIPKLDCFGEFLTKYNIHFFVEKGDILINFNVKKNKEPLKLYPQAKWNTRCTTRLIDKIYITSEKYFVLWAIIERVF